jgi:hypothetical protein
MQLNKKVLSGLLVVTGVLAGTAGSIALSAHAQSTTTAAAPVVTTTNTSVIDTPEAGDTPDAADALKAPSHRSLGGDGVISSINGTTIMVAEESDEGSATYTIDASGATVTNNGVAATLATLKVGDKIFVDGTTMGTTVKATSISLGHKGEHESGSDTDNTNEDGSSSAE